MSKKAKDGLTPENFLDAYRPLTPGRGNPQGASETKAELPKVEADKPEAGTGDAVPILSSRSPDKTMTADEYIELFVEPNRGKTVRSKHAVYLDPILKSDLALIKQALEDDYPGISVSLIVNNLIIHHFSTFRDVILELVARSKKRTSFLSKK